LCLKALKTHTVVYRDALLPPKSKQANLTNVQGSRRRAAHKRAKEQMEHRENERQNTAQGGERESERERQSE
jgi:hypothetical protein